MKKMMMKMEMKMSLWLLLCGLTAAAAAGPGSCVGRCGEVFTRGQRCTCDFSCLQHNECCSDFQATCTTAQSCQGRCGEAFSRGQPCECDPQCVQYNTCCHDYQLHCDARASVSHSRTFQPVKTSGNGRSESSWRSNSASEEWYTVMRNIPVGLLPASIPSSHRGAPDWPTRGSALPSNSAPPVDSSAPVRPSGPGAADAHPVAPSRPSQGRSGSRPRTSTLQDVAQALGLVGGGSEAPGTGLLADVNLCSDSPINVLTALPNGTILIFKGEHFWSVEPVSRSVGRPQSIKDTLGVPSPIDTVFTRCNCHGNTYIIKGDQFWRLDGNLVMEQGYPKPLASEFPGLTGRVSAALAVPETRTRPETVYFFKNDLLQSFSFPGSSSSCRNKPLDSFRRRSSRQAVRISADIDIKVSLKGFPTPVTSALSLPSPQSTDLYEHYVFSGSLFFSVQISDDLPVLVKPNPSAFLVPRPVPAPVLSPIAAVAANMAAQNASPPLPANSIRVWLGCL